MVRGSHAIVTVPLGVLPAGAITFEPVLDRRRAVAIDAVPFGAFEKVALAYEERFWQPSPSGVIVVADDAAEQWLSLIDLTEWHGRPVLVATTSGDHARTVSRWSEADRIGSVQSIVDVLAGGRAPEPVAALATSWTTDPLALGSYTHCGRSADEFRAARAELARPHGRVLFAGEATSAEAYALVDGAWTSGIREAMRLLQAPAVRL